MAIWNGTPNRHFSAEAGVSKKMRILMLADVFSPDIVGGAGRVAHHLSHQLAQRGHQVDVLTRNPDGNLPSSQQMEANLFVHRFDLPAKEGIGFFFCEIKNGYKDAKRAARKANFDLVCAHQSLAASGPLFSSAVGQMPFVYCFHSSWHEEYLIKKRNMKGETPWSAKVVAFFMKKMEKRILCKAMKVFVLSRYSEKQISAFHHLPRESVVIIPGGVDLNRFRLPDYDKEAIKKSLDVPSERTMFLTVRNLVPRMGIENLIEAFKQSDILKEKGLLLIGGEGFLKESLAAVVKGSSLERSVKFLGRISEDDLPRYYQAADFFVLPTREMEGFGLVILEAMASGTPVLGTPVGAIPETIGVFAKRLLFEGTHSKGMKSKLEDVINRPEEYQFDPHVCRRFIEERYSWEKMADAFENGVMSLLNRQD
jgi:glycosyltransferase involved in cell wall biosynthesis